MSISSNLDRICVAALAFCAPALGYEAASGGVVLGYEERLFDTSVVHTIDIVMDDWEGFIAGCEDEEYVLCDLVIDGEDWGLYLAVEGVEESFLLRNYGTDYGELYKPDSMEMGGGRGNGGGFSGRGGMGGMPSDMGEPPEDMGGGLLSMLPWDYNLAFGGFMGSSDAEALVNWSIDDPTSDGDTESRPMLAWIFESEEYTELYHAAFAEFIESVFTSGEFERLFDETVELISPYVERGPTKFCTYEEFELGAETLREFCLPRAESIGYQLAGEDVTVDASGLDISAMGSMNNTAGGGDKGFRG